MKDPKPAAPSIQVVDADGKPVKSVEAGENVHLQVKNGSFTDASLKDKDETEIPADDGEFSKAKESTPSANATGTDGASEDGQNDSQTEDAQNNGFAPGGAASSAIKQVSADLENSDSGSSDESSDEASGSAEDSSTPEESADSTGTSSESSDASSSPADLKTDPKGTAWESDYSVAGNSTYEWTATVVGKDGKPQQKTGTIETGKPASETTRTTTEISDDDTVGVGAPIIINFSGIVPKKYRASLQNRMSVTVTDDSGKKRDVTGAFAWLPDDDGHSRVHYRTKEFWPADSKVHVNLPMKGVRTSDETFGAKNLKLDFTVGREQIVKASAKTHRMKVYRNGKEIWNFPASLGKPGAPSHNGQHIVMSKSADYTMTSDRFNYSTPVKWAVRIHNNGEFVHSAPWSTGSQGSENVSHGCINLAPSAALKYYKSAIYGDPVSISGSSVSLTPDSGDISDWEYSWKQWEDLSAIKK